MEQQSYEVESLQLVWKFQKHGLQVPFNESYVEY